MYLLRLFRTSNYFLKKITTFGAFFIFPTLHVGLIPFNPFGVSIKCGDTIGKKRYTKKPY